MAADQESGLLNLAHGDKDSLGLFQQRTSQGWGTPAQLLTPSYAATAFYRALVGVPHWEVLPMDQAAQAVQHSAQGSLYAKWIPTATTLADALWSGMAAQILCGAAAPPQGGSGAGVNAVLTFASEQLGKPYQFGAEGPDTYDCSGLALRAFEPAGIGLPRTSQQQYVAGPAVTWQVEPGDLVFFDPDENGLPGHVGIYVGNGLMIDAPHTGAVVREEPVVGFGTYMGATRPEAGASA